MGLKHYHIQILDGLLGTTIETSGGVAYVATSGDTTKLTIKNADGAAASNPTALTNGRIDFYTADTVTNVDLYIQAPDGQFVVAKGITTGINELLIDTGRIHQVMVIPWAAADVTAATEIDTGFDLPVFGAALPTPLIRVTAIDATETIDVGLKSGETAGDADGFVAGLSVGTLGLVKATVLNGSNTMGALFEVQDSANAGDLTHEPHVVTGSNATSVTFTLSTGSDTGKGFILLPYINKI